MEVEGRVKALVAEQVFGQGFRKAEVIVETNDQYPQVLAIEFVQDKCDLITNLKVGQQVKVSINLRGREWVSPQGETKYFNSIQGWRIEAQSAPAAAPTQAAPTKAVPEAPLEEEDHDDLPF